MSKFKLPRLDASGTMSDHEATATLEAMADNLEKAQDHLGMLRPELAQAHTLQALGLAAYVLLGVGGQD